MIMALQIAGSLILITAFLQGAFAVYQQVSRYAQGRRLHAKRLGLVQLQLENTVKQNEIVRKASELTWSGKRKFRVISRTQENKSADICSFHLAPHDGGTLAPFEPGQFLTFELAIPGQARPVVRCYSLSDSPLQLDRYRVSIKRVPPPPGAPESTPGGLSSGFFHSDIKEGDVVDVLAPNGRFHLKTQSDRPVVLIAGGVGITPVLSMLKWLAGKNSHRETWIFYAARNGQDIAFQDEIRKAIANKPNFHAVFVFSHPSENCVEGSDYDCAGFLTADVMKRYLASSNYEFYICGPPPMMEMTTKQLDEWGVPEEDIHFEAFGPASVKKVAPPPSDQKTGLSGVTVEFARSGRTVTWTPEDGTVLELAEAHDVTISCGCRAGNCGSCATAIKSGSVSYQTKSASKPPQGTALVCIAKPDGNLVLDA